MNYYTQMSLKDKKREDEIAKCKVKCKHCGHIIIMTEAERTICRYCGFWVFKNDKIEFEYRLKERMNKECSKRVEE